MATISVSGATVPTLPGGVHNASLFAVEKVVDFSVLNGDVAEATGDVIQVLQIPKGTVVLTAGIEVLTATATASVDVDMGDGADPNRYVDAATLATTGQVTPVATTGTAALGAGCLYAADDTIDLTIIGAWPAAGVIRVWAVCVNGYQNGPTTARTMRDTATYTRA